MSGARIAYLGWGNSPCNYRRFSKFSQLTGLQAELYEPEKSYDLIIVTQNSDLTTWSRLPRSGPKVIFDFVDSYLKMEPWELKANLRGLAKFVARQHRNLDWNYSNLLRRMIERADAVVCSTPEQKVEYFEFNQNTHDILDFNDDQIGTVKKDYQLGSCINFVWEGMGGNSWAFQEIAPVLKSIYRKMPIALHLVTDVKYKSHQGPFAWNIEVRPYLKEILGDIPIYLYEWNPIMLSSICARCDVALLPIPRTPAIYWAKPENRLLMLWRMGLPVVASANPAFLRSMRAAGNLEACDSLGDWEDKLEALISSETLRRESAQRGRAYAEERASDELLCQKWLRVLASVS